MANTAEESGLLISEPIKKAPKPSHLLYGLLPAWLIVPGATISLFGLGVIYSWGTLSVYVSAPGFLKDTPSSKAVFCYAVAGAQFPFMMILGTFLQNYMSPISVTLIASSLITIGWILSAFVSTFAGLLVTWGFIAGFGVPLGYVCAVVVPQQWFPRYKGLVSGIVLSGFGLGSFGFNIVIKLLANPDGMPTKQPPNDPTWPDRYHETMIANVPRAMIAVGLLAGGLAALGGLTLQRAPPQPPARVLPSYVDNQAAVPQIKIDYTPHEMIHTPQFWALLAAFSAAMGSGLFIIGSFASFAQKECSFTPPYDIVGGLGATFNAIGRIFWGKLCDKIGFRKCLFAETCTMCFLMLIYFETRDNVFAYTCVTVGMFFVFGGVPAVFPSAAGDTFGPKNMGRNYSILFFAYAIASLGQALLLTTLMSIFGTYRFLFYAMALVCATSATIAFFFKKRTQLVGHSIKLTDSIPDASEPDPGLRDN